MNEHFHLILDAPTVHILVKISAHHRIPPIEVLRYLAAVELARLYSNDSPITEVRSYHYQKG